MKIQKRQDIVGKRIVDMQQTEIISKNKFAYRRVFLTLHDGILFELASQDPKTDPFLVLPNIDKKTLVHLKESDVVEQCLGKRILEVCFAYFTPNIFILVDGINFLWISCDEYGFYVDLASVDSEDIDLSRIFTFWGHKKLDLNNIDKSTHDKEQGK